MLRPLRSKWAWGQARLEHQPYCQPRESKPATESLGGPLAGSCSNTRRCGSTYPPPREAALPRDEMLEARPTPTHDAARTPLTQRACKSVLVRPLRRNPAVKHPETLAFPAPHGSSNFNDLNAAPVARILVLD